MPISEQYKYLNSLWGLKVYTGMTLEVVQTSFKRPKVQEQEILFQNTKHREPKKLIHSIATEWNKLDIHTRITF